MDHMAQENGDGQAKNKEHQGLAVGRLHSGGGKVGLSRSRLSDFNLAAINAPSY
jgi:hypothetical protein